MLVISAKENGGALASRCWLRFTFLLKLLRSTALLFGLAEAKLVSEFAIEMEG